MSLVTNLIIIRKRVGLRVHNIFDLIKTSLLRRLQAQTLPDATPPIGRIYPFSKMAVTFEPVMRF